MQKRINQTVPVLPMTVIMPVIDKVFATNQCIWCNRLFDGYYIRCRFCKNCQYCGMVTMGDDGCHTCGNHTDDELKREIQERQTIIY